MATNTPEAPEQGDESLLLNVATLVAERRSLPEVFGAFAKRLITATAFDYASLILYEPDRRFGRIVASFPRGTHPAPGEEVRPIADFHMEEVGRAPEGLLYRVLGEPGRPTEVMVRGGLTRAWTVPLFVDGTMQAQVTVARICDEKFAPEELTFLRTAATLLSGAVREHVRDQLAVREHARAAVISELSLLLHSGERLESFLARLPSLLAPAVDFDAATLVEFGDDSAQGYSVCRETNTVSTEALLGPGIVAGFVQSLGASLAQMPGAELPAGLRTSHGEAGGIDDSVALAALKDSGRLLGAFVLRRGGHAPLDASDTAFVELLTTLLGQALSNRLQLQRQQQELAEQRAIAAIVADTAQETDPFELTVSFARHLRDVVPDSIVGFGFLQPDDTVEFRIFGDQTVRVPLLSGTSEAGNEYWIYDSIPEEYGGRTPRAWRKGFHGHCRAGWRFHPGLPRRWHVAGRIPVPGPASPSIRCAGSDCWARVDAGAGRQGGRT
jgi:GAF domain-containing protein